MTNAHLIQWDFNHSCFEIIGHFDSIAKAAKRRAECMAHFNYQGHDLEVISDYTLGWLEAQA